MTTLIRLMFEFFKTGLFSIGGGLATLPFLYEMSDKTGWFSHADIADMIAISECTPGAIGINMSTYAGYKTAGVPGGILATIALGTPSVIIILIIAAFLKNFATLEIVQHAFAGIRVCVCVLILQAVLRLWKKSVIDPFTLALYLIIFALNAFSGVLPFKIPAAVLVICAGIAGIIAREIKKRRGTSPEKGGDA